MTQFPLTAGAAKVQRRWDPRALLGLVNPNGEFETCVGKTSSSGHRCRRVVLVADANRAFEKLAKLDPLPASFSPDLRRAANCMLCNQHDKQIDEVVIAWQNKIRNLRVGAKPEPEPKAASKGFGMKDMRSRIEQLQEKFRKSAEKGAAPAKEKEEEAKKQRQQGHQKREEWGRERERQERERRAREVREREEAFRQKDCRRAHEREEIEKRDWGAAWARYSQAWQAIEASQDVVRPPIPRSKGADAHLQQLTCHDIPWPTKSGMLLDFSEDNVRLFFRKAAPVHLSSEPEEELFRLMSLENKRWHTDKILSRFGQEALESSLADYINRTSKLMVQLWKEAKGAKGSRKA